MSLRVVIQRIVRTVKVAARGPQGPAGSGGGGGGGAVDSVNGHIGTVVLTKSDVGLGSVDNTADTAKPVSTAQAAADTAATAAAVATSLQKASNLSDLASAATARTNLGLGSLATQSGTFSGTSSGTNTGDQTITLTGDVTGSGTGSFAATLANSGVTATSYGSATQIPVLTIDAKGRVTAATTAPITSAPSRFVMAAEIIPAVTNGCLVNSSSTTTNGVTYDTVDFDGATQQTGWVTVMSPKGWAGSTITITPHWTADSGTGGVVWGFAARFLADTDSIDQAAGTEQTSTDTFQSAAIEHVGPTTSAITPAGTAAGERMLVIRVRRNPSDASDTLGISARLIAFCITWG